MTDRPPACLVALAQRPDGAPPLIYFFAAGPDQGERVARQLTNLPAGTGAVTVYAVEAIDRPARDVGPEPEPLRRTAHAPATPGAWIALRTPRDWPLDGQVCLFTTEAGALVSGTFRTAYGDSRAPAFLFSDERRCTLCVYRLGDVSHWATAPPVPPSPSDRG